LDELKESGYLQSVPAISPAQSRTLDHKQASDVEPSPWNENGVRALEGD